MAKLDSRIGALLSSLSPPQTVKNMDADVDGLTDADDGRFRLSSPQQRSQTFNKTGFGRRQRWTRLRLAHEWLPLENKRLKESECQSGRNLELYKSNLANVQCQWSRGPCLGIRLPTFTAYSSMKNRSTGDRASRLMDIRLQYCMTWHVKRILRVHSNAMTAC